MITADDFAGCVTVWRWTVYKDCRVTMVNSATVDGVSVPDTEHSQPSTADNACTTSEKADAKTSSRFQTPFGCLHFRPSCLQFLASARWFLFLMCFAAFFQSFAVNGLLGVGISTIERRFGLSSSQTAWIPATYEIAGAPVLLVIGYIGLKLRRPIWIGSGLIIICIAFFIYIIPHFAAPQYRYADSSNSSNLCQSKNASSTVRDRYTAPNMLCLLYTSDAADE